MASPKLILLISKFALFNNKTLPLVENLLLLLTGMSHLIRINSVDIIINSLKQFFSPRQN